MPEKRRKKPRTNQASGPLSKEEGEVWLTNLDPGRIFEEPALDADKVLNYEQNYYIRRLLENQRTLIFMEEPEQYGVLDPDGEPDTDLTVFMTRMLKKVNVWTAFQHILKDRSLYAAAPFNPVWGDESWNGLNYYSLRKLNHLPPYTFREAPAKYKIIFSDIMKGIALNDENKIEYWQHQSDGVTRQLKNVVLVTDPLANDPVGEPFFRPLYPIITMLDYAWQGQMQLNTALAAGGVACVKLDEGYTEDDWDYAQDLLRNIGKNYRFILKHNMTAVSFPISPNTVALDTISALMRMCDDFLTPISALRKEGTLIGGSNWAEFEAHNNYIRGVHAWLVSGINGILQPFFEYNDLEGYRINFNLPTPSLDRAELWMKQAIALGDLVAKGVTVAEENEFRSLLERPEFDEEKIAGLKEKQKSQTPTDPLFKLEQEKVEVARMEAVAKLTGNALNPYRVAPKKWVQARLRIEEGETGE